MWQQLENIQLKAKQNIALSAEDIDKFLKIKAEEGELDNLIRDAINELGKRFADKYPVIKPTSEPRILKFKAPLNKWRDINLASKLVC